VVVVGVVADLVQLLQDLTLLLFTCSSSSQKHVVSLTEHECTKAARFDE